MQQFEGRVAVVTGGAAGLGAAMGSAFAAEGMRVLLADIDGEGAARVAKQLESTGAQAASAHVDVGDADSLDALAECARRTFGSCDLLAANVGVQRIARFDAMSREEFAWLIETNVIGTADTVRAFLPLLRASSDAHVLLTGSINSLVTVEGLVGYSTSKMAVLGLAEGLALELGEQGIAVTALLPAGMATSHLESSDRARPEQLGDPAEIDGALIAKIAAAISPTPESIVAPEYAIRDLIPALRDGRRYLVTHGPIPSAFDERVEAIRAAIRRADEV